MKNIKSIQQVIKANTNTVYNKWGRCLKTQIVWVDELPKEACLWHAEAPSDYRGYRNMEQGSNLEHVNSHMAALRRTYDAGPWGYLYYNAVLYVRRDIWRSFHINPYSCKQAALRSADTHKGFAVLWDGSELEVYNDLQVARSVAKVFSNAKIILKL